MAKKYQLSRGRRLLASLLEKTLNLDDARRDAIQIGLIKFHGSNESAQVVRDYMAKYAFPSYAERFLHRYPVTAVFCSMPILRHHVNDIVFFHKELTSKRDVDQLLTRALYRAFYQRLFRLGVSFTFGRQARFFKAFRKRFVKETV